jgi:putative membrane protein
MIAIALLIADSSFDNHMGDWGAGWWILMALMMVVFWGLVIVGTVWLIRALMSERHGHGHGGRSAIEVLDHRLASGEITPEEYRQRRTVIQGKGESSSGAS